MVYGKGDGAPRMAVVRCARQLTRYAATGIKRAHFFVRMRWTPFIPHAQHPSTAGLVDTGVGQK